MQYKRFIIALITVWCEYNFLRVEGICGINARQVQENEFTSVVGFMKYNTSTDMVMDIFCSGVLVSKYHVLTSSNCFEQVNTMYEMRILLGSNNKARGNLRRTEWIMSYSNWLLDSGISPDLGVHDIGMTKLTKKAHYTIVPASCGYVESNTLYGKTALIVGWGVTDNGHFPNYLVTAEVHILSKEECIQKSYQLNNVYQPLHDRYLCSQNVPYALLNFGDNGGPLMQNNMILGIANGLYPPTFGQNYYNKINLHVSINYYKEFIGDLLTK